jgi:hypothetical protein
LNFNISFKYDLLFKAKDKEMLKEKKNVFYTKILGLCLLTLISLSCTIPRAVSAPSVSKFVNLNVFWSIATVPEKSYWCGQAAVANVINYHIGYYAVDPGAVASYTGDRLLAVWDVADALNWFSRCWHLGKGSHIIWYVDIYTIVREINNNRPIVLRLGPGGPQGGWRGHFVVILGYSYQILSNGQITQFQVFTYDLGWINSYGVAPSIITFS